MRKKKKGSSLVLVVFVTALIITTATTMLTLISTDYKSRVNRSNQVKNLYEADSGQNYVKNVIQKMCDLAMLSSSNKVAEEYSKGSLVDDYEMKNDAYDEANSRFKEYFIKELMECDTTNSECENFYKTDAVKSYKEGNKLRLLTYCIENLKYRYVDTSNESAIKTKRSEIYNILSNKIYLKDGSPYISEMSFYDSELTQNDLKIEVIAGKTEIVINRASDEYKIVFVVKSVFKDKTKGKSSIDNMKTIQLKYTINAPDYEPNFVAETTKVPVREYGIERAITADKDMIVNKGIVTVDGECWIKGSTPASKKSVEKDNFDKYNGGTEVNNSSLYINSNLYTNGTVSLTNKSSLRVEGDLYCLNSYLGPLDGKDISSSNNILNVKGNLVTNNDIAINSSNSRIDIDKNYYGINDKTVGEVTSIAPDGTNNGSVDGSYASRQSSSIIINNIENNQVEINDTAYIAGVSYINLDGYKYQTGESVGVKGNYKAYTDVLPEYSDKIDMAQFGDYKLIKGTLEEKAQYFVDYYKQNKVIDGGVYIKNIRSIGAYTNNSTIGKGELLTEDKKKIKGEQDNYSREVLCLGITDDLAKNKLDLGNVYNNYEVTRTVATQIKNFKPLINFGKYSEVAINPQSIGDRTLFNYIYNPDEDNVVVVKNDGVYIRDNNKEERKIENEEYVDANNNKIKYTEAVIITKGDVIFENNNGDNTINYYGSIIAGGNVIFNADKVNIVYDDVQVDKDGKLSSVRNVSELVTLTIGEISTTNENLYDIFNYNNYVREDEKGEFIITTNNADRIVYDTEKYLKEGLWKIISKNE